MTSRLGRVVDRVRKLEDFIEAGEEETLRQRHTRELAALDRRLRFGNRAVFFCTTSAVLICLLVAVVFVLGFFGSAAGIVVALLFFCAVTCLSFGLISFLWEVRIATSILRVRHELLPEDSGQ